MHAVNRLIIAVTRGGTFTGGIRAEPEAPGEPPAPGPPAGDPAADGDAGFERAFAADLKAAVSTGLHATSAFL